MWEGASPWSCSESVPPGELAPPSGSSSSRLCTSAYSASSIPCQLHHHPTWLIVIPPCKTLLIYAQGTPWWIGAWVGKNRVISVLRLQCLPKNPKISTTITRNTHNICLQAEILHHLHNRQRQGNTISSSGGGHPNVSVLSLLTYEVVRRQWENFLCLATRPKVVADYYILYFWQPLDNTDFSANFFFVGMRLCDSFDRSTGQRRGSRSCVNLRKQSWSTSDSNGNACAIKATVFTSNSICFGCLSP